MLVSDVTKKPIMVEPKVTWKNNMEEVFGEKKGKRMMTWFKDY